MGFERLKDSWVGDRVVSPGFEQASTEENDYEDYVNRDGDFDGGAAGGGAAEIA
jgi:hypothetical protein